MAQRPFMPPSQSAMPVPPTLPPNATPGDVSTDALSPTTLVLNYLKSKGMQPGNPNYAQAIRTAVDENARNPGLIPGLMNSAPGTDQGGAPQGGSATAGRPAPPAVMPPGITNPTQTPDRRDVGGGTNTSAPPTSSTPSGGGGGLNTDNLLATAGLAAPSIASLILGNRAGPMPNVGQENLGPGTMPPTGRVMDVPPTAIAGNQPPMLPPPSGQPPPPGGAPPGTGPTDMEAAMQRATAPASAPLQIGQSPVAGVAPIGPASTVQPIGPPGAADMTPPRGPVEPVAPQVPFPPRATPRGPMPTVVVRPTIPPVAGRILRGFRE